MNKDIQESFDYITKSKSILINNSDLFIDNLDNIDYIITSETEVLIKNLKPKVLGYSIADIDDDDDDDIIEKILSNKISFYDNSDNQEIIQLKENLVKTRKNMNDEERILALEEHNKKIREAINKKEMEKRSQYKIYKEQQDKKFRQDVKYWTITTIGVGATVAFGGWFLAGISSPEGFSATLTYFLKEGPLSSFIKPGTDKDAAGIVKFILEGIKNNKFK